MEIKNNKLGKGTIILIIVLIVIVLGLGGYVVYDKFFVSDDSLTNNISNTTDLSNELVSITYKTYSESDIAEEVETTTKTITDTETISKIINAINTKTISNETGFGGTLLPTLDLNYEINSISIVLLGGNYFTINNQLYKVTSANPNFADYIASLFE